MTIERELPIKITDEERDHHAREAAGKRSEIAKIEVELEEFTRPRKKKIKALAEEAEKLEAAASTGTMLAMVECEEAKNFSLNEFRVIRKDTDETVEGPRALSGKERQTMLIDMGEDAEEGEEGASEAPKPKRGKRRVKLPTPGSQNN